MIAAETEVSRRAWLNITVTVAAILAIGAAVATTQLPEIAAGGLLYPARHDSIPAPPAGCEDRDFAGDGVTLRGWYCRAPGQRRGSIIYLHGTADNRASGAGIIQRSSRKGLDVIAYDSRRHGKSDGEVCTYGYHEKEDLRRVIDTIAAGPLILFGTSLGAAVAVQEAAGDRRVTGIIGVEIFSDLRTVATERAPFFLTASVIEKAIDIAEARGAFEIDRVSPVKAAESIRVPVLLVHGADDVDTRPAHSERVYDALAGPKRLILVEHAGHNESLSEARTWTEIEQWIDAVLRSAGQT